jgi:hypothetical protein
VDTLEIIHAYRTAAENCATMSMNVAAESALSSSRRFTLLQKFKKLPLVAQGELIWLLELEGICQFTSGNQSKAIELCQQQIEIELFLFGKTGDGLDLLKAKLRLFSFVTSPPPLAPLAAAAATHHRPLSSLANEILQEMYSLFCCSGDGILSTADFFLLCKRYVLNPKYHPHISEWLREREVTGRPRWGISKIHRLLRVLPVVVVEGMKWVLGQTNNRDRRQKKGKRNNESDERGWLGLRSLLFPSIETRGGRS